MEAATALQHNNNIYIYMPVCECWQGVQLTRLFEYTYLYSNNRLTVIIATACSSSLRYNIYNTFSL